MESDKTPGVYAMQWQEPMVFAARPRETGKLPWEPVVLAAVCFLHAALIAYGYNWQKDLLTNTLSEDEALQISFIDRIAVPDSKPSASPEEQIQKKVLNPPLTLTSIEEAVQVDIESPEIRDSRPLRLTMDVDEWQSSTAIAPRNPLKRQYIAIAGRAEPFIHGIKLSNRLTPEQRLQKVGKLFGAVEYDPCKEARNRMASGQSSVSEFDLEHDLRNIERHCRP